jgi:hypothetical protein
VGGHQEGADQGLMTRPCGQCSEEKGDNAFYSGRGNWCKDCLNKHRRELRHERLADARAYDLARYRANPQKVIEANRKRHLLDPRKRLLVHAKIRAKSRGLEFSLTLNDIIFPILCPVLGIPLTPGKQYAPGCPSLDRFDNSKGYIPANVTVISHRANTIKTNASLGELRQVVAWMEAR